MRTIICPICGMKELYKCPTCGKELNKRNFFCGNIVPENHCLNCKIMRLKLNNKK